jgi:hypothetical protein
MRSLKADSEQKREIEKEKLHMTRAYSKKVKEKSFQIGNLVWETILPLADQDNRFSKCHRDRRMALIRLSVLFLGIQIL